MGQDESPSYIYQALKTSKKLHGSTALEVGCCHVEGIVAEIQKHGYEVRLVAFH